MLQGPVLAHVVAAHNVDVRGGAREMHWGGSVKKAFTAPDLQRNFAGAQQENKAQSPVTSRQRRAILGTSRSQGSCSIYRDSHLLVTHQKERPVQKISAKHSSRHEHDTARLLRMTSIAYPINFAQKGHPRSFWTCINCACLRKCVSKHGRDRQLASTAVHCAPR